VPGIVPTVPLEDVLAGAHDPAMKHPYKAAGRIIDSDARLLFPRKPEPDGRSLSERIRSGAKQGGAIRTRLWLDRGHRSVSDPGEESAVRLRTDRGGKAGPSVKGR
jgi:hypothetical protein